MHALPNERINNALQVAMLCIDRAMDDQRQVFPLLASFVVSTPLMVELILIYTNVVWSSCVERWSEAERMKEDVRCMVEHS